MLKLIIDSLDGLDAGIAALYALNADGKYHLQVEVAAAPGEDAKVKEFRENNVKLMKDNQALQKRMDDLAAKFKGIDPEEYQKMSDAAKAAAEKGLIDAGKIDEVVEQRVATMKESFDKQLKDAEAGTEKLNARLSTLLIDAQVATIGAKAGVKGDAIDLVTGMARDVFRIVDEAAVPYAGEEVIFGEDGKPQQMEEWIKVLSTSKPFLFESSAGGGGGGGEANKGAGGTIAKGDIGANLDKVASGEVTVDMDQ